MRPTHILLVANLLFASSCVSTETDDLAGNLARADALFDAAQNEQEMDAAIAAYSRALEFDPDCAAAYLGLGRSHKGMMMARFYVEPRDEDGALAAGSRAEHALLRAIEIEPALVDAYLELADVYRTPGRYTETVDLLEPALASNPDDVRLLTYLGRALFDLGRPGEAQRPLRRAHELGAVPWTFRYLGWTDFHLGRFDDQLTWFEEYVAIQPGNNQGQGGIVLAYLGQRDFAKATAYAEALVRDNPEHRFLNLYLSKAGEAHLFAGNVRQAIAWYERALEIDPLSRNQYSVRLASTTLGHLYMRLGREGEAKVLLARTIDDTMRRIEGGDERWERRYDVASAHASLGERDLAVDWLRQAVAAGLPAPQFLRMDPLWSELREDPEFVRLAAQVEDRIAEQRRLAESR